MGKTQKHQSKGAASLDSQQDSSADGAEGDYLTFSHRSRIVKGAGIHIQIVIWVYASIIDFESGQCGEGCSGDED